MGVAPSPCQPATLLEALECETVTGFLASRRSALQLRHSAGFAPDLPSSVRLGARTGTAWGTIHFSDARRRLPALRAV